MELKYRRIIGINPSVLRSNRTFMELKYLPLGRYPRQDRCSNRTFMELKFGGEILIIITDWRF